MNLEYTRKKILFINQLGPYGSSIGQEAQELLLMASAFDQDISVLFINDGVMQLKAQQQPEKIQLKNYSMTYKALPLYDIEKIYVASDSLRQRNLKITDLIVETTLVSADEIQAILQSHDFIFNF